MARDEVLKNVLDAEFKVRRMKLLPEIIEVGAVEFFVLTALEEGGGRLFVSEIAKLLNVSSPNVSRVLRGMELDGKIKREIDELDRRNVSVLLTERGERFLHASQRDVLLFFHRALLRLSDEDLVCYTGLLEKVYGAYESELKELKGKKQGLGGSNV